MHQKDWLFSLWKTFESGGFMMWPLLVLSITALALILERTFTIRVTLLTPLLPITNALSMLRAKTFQEKHLRVLLKKGSTGKLLHDLLQNAMSQEAAEKHILIEGQNLELRLKRFTHILGTIALISPLMGLLGTVIGMMSVFAVLVHSGGAPSDLASGLSVALSTTAFGLFIAIPSTFAHRHFTQKIELILSEYHTIAQMILDAITPIFERQQKNPKS